MAGRTAGSGPRSGTGRGSSGGVGGRSGSPVRGVAAAVLLAVGMGGCVSSARPPLRSSQAPPASCRASGAAELGIAAPVFRVDRGTETRAGNLPDGWPRVAFDPGIDLRWERPTEADARWELDRWCRAVGPPVVASFAAAAPDGGPRSERARRPPADHLTVVAWNLHVGAGAVDELLDDLRAGRITGIPERDFVLLFQEAMREGGGVPDSLPRDARSADRIDSSREPRAATTARLAVALDGPADAGAASIEEVARRHGLHLVYVPSMRNGVTGEERVPEDRGNAILSTLGLGDPRAIELPVQVQRRVAVAATLSLPGSRGLPSRDLRLVSLHLDHRAPWSRIHESLGSGRARQARHLIESLEGTGPVVVGGDLNTWFGGAGEEAVRLMRSRFPLPREVPEGPTLETPFLPDRTVDHLFFRLPLGWSAEYRILEDSYGSDHRPLVGWIRWPSEAEGPDDGGSRNVE